MKKIVFALVVFALLITVGSYFASGDGFNFCSESNYRACISLVNNISEPLFWSFLPLLATSLLLLFARRETFIVWVKFAVPAFIAMLAIIFYTYNNEPIIGGWVSFGSDDQLATVLGPSLFFLISLVIIAVNSYRLRQA